MKNTFFLYDILASGIMSGAGIFSYYRKQYVLSVIGFPAD